MTSRKPTFVFVLPVILICLPFLALACYAQQPAGDEPRFTPPPGTETAAIKELIDRAAAALAGGKSKPSDLLANPEYMPAHEWPRFRKLISDHAGDNNVTIVTPQEPGEPLVVTGTIRDKQGKPVKGARVYVYQTSAKGWYSDKAPHISGNSGDEKYARLFGYFTTDENGKYELRTIRPAGYPRSTLPAHIHVEIEARSTATAANGATNAEPRTLISEIQFDDDPRQTSESRADAARQRWLVLPVTRGANGGQRVTADFRLE